jgi:hypothetical protein
MANNLTRKDDSSYDRKVVIVDESAPAPPIAVEKIKPRPRNDDAADAMRYMMDNMRREGYASEREFQHRQQQQMENRRSGKSFRGMLWCLNQASEGRQAIFVCQNYHEIDRMAHATMNLAASYLSGDFFRYNHNGPSHRIEFSNGGLITFIDHDTHMYNQNNRRSAQCYEVFDDCWDHRR